jgi:hypothetical protein
VITFVCLFEEPASPETLLRRTPYPSVKKRHQVQTNHRSTVQPTTFIQQQQQRPQAQQQSFRRQRIFDENALRPSTHTVVYDSSQAIPSSTAIAIRRTDVVTDDVNLSRASFGGSGNESDYDNNQCAYGFSSLTKYLPSSTRSMSIPVNDYNQSNQLTRIDDLLLGDQNEIILHHDSNLNSTIIPGNDDDDNSHDETDSSNIISNDDTIDNHNENQAEAHVRLTDDTHDLHTDECVRSSLHFIDNHQSDNHSILSTMPSRASSQQPRTNNFSSIRSTTNATLDDSAPSTNSPAYSKEASTARKQLDFRSHLLLNTTLDAT